MLMSFDLKFNKPRSSHLSLTYRTVSPKKRSLPWYLHHSFSLYCTTWNLRRAHLDTYSTYLALIPSHDHQDLWFSPSTATSSSSWLPPPLSLSLSFTNCSQKKKKKKKENLALEIDDVCDSRAFEIPIIQYSWPHTSFLTHDPTPHFFFSLRDTYSIFDAHSD